jgi:predicted regulator of Ras-like GTPase activity (Roadblock/LC7/MglB family)
MSKNELEPKLAKIMDQIPETEGIIAFDITGKVISGQLITQTMNKDDIAKKAHSLWETFKTLGQSIGKGNVTEVMVTLSKGYAIIIFGEKFSIISILEDRAQVSLLSKSIKNLMV